MNFLHLATPVLVCAALGAPAPQSDAPKAGPEPELGTLGTVAPQSGDVRLPDTLVHEDKIGGNNQTLQALCGSRGGGFAMVWRDQRDGMLGVYLARLGAEGELSEPERPIHAPHAGRRRDPAVGLRPDGSGLTAWISEFGPQTVPYVRTFDASGVVAGGDRVLDIDPEHPAGVPTVRGSAPHLPAVLALGNGDSVIVWTTTGNAWLQELDAHGDLRGRPRRIAEGGVEGGVTLAMGTEGELLCVFKVKDQNQALDPMQARAKAHACGAGTLASLRADPAGGFWALFEHEGKALLRHLARDGKPDRAELEPVAAPVGNVDLAVTRSGLALAFEAGVPPVRGGRGERGERMQRPAPEQRPAQRGGPPAPSLAPVQVQWLDRSGVVQGAAVRVLPEAAKPTGRALLASNGELVLVAWTDLREGHPDVYARIYDPNAADDARLRPERRVNTDVASADQTNPSLASNGERALVCWQDRRDGRNRIYARRIDAQGLQGGEVAVPASLEEKKEEREAQPCDQPAAALRADGDWLVTWHLQTEAGPVLRAQAFRADGRALAAPFTVDEGQHTLGGAPAALIGMPAERGWLVAWPRKDKQGVWVRRVGADGKPDGNARRISDEGDEQTENPALALLDDQRVIAVWDRHAEGGAWTIRGRFVDLEGGKRGDELSFEPSQRNQDWDPCVAPAADNGFVLSWCSGEPTDFSRDVVARVFNSRGRPVGPLMTVCFMANEQDFPQIVRMADGSHVVAWEDDISYYDHTYLRRILPSAHELGPIVRLNELETKACEDRVAPWIVPLGDGLVGTFGDRRRSLGWDVFVRVLGPRFDAVEKR